MEPRTPSQIYWEHVDSPSVDSIDIEGLCKQHPSLARALRELHLHATSATQWARAAGALRTESSAAPTDDSRLGKTEAIPAQLGSYELIEEVGRGGMGTVYRAKHKKGLDGLVALKIIDQTLLSAKHEASMAARLRHRCFPVIIDIGDEDGHAYFVMELIDGQRIDRFVATTKLDDEAFLDMFLELIDGVAWMHDAGVVHCDLKPDNILVEAAGRPRVLDLGLAQVLGQPATRPAAGTHGYMSREQEFRLTQPTSRWDVFALGKILAELNAARTPRPPRSGTARQRWEEFRAVADKAAAERPEEGLATVRELAEELRRLKRDEPVEALPSTLGYQLRKWRQRNRITVRAFAALMLVLVLLAASLLRTLRAEAETERLLVYAMDYLQEDLQRVTEMGAWAGAQQLVDSEFRRIAKTTGEMLEVRPEAPEFQLLNAWLLATRGSDALLRGATQGGRADLQQAQRALGELEHGLTAKRARRILSFTRVRLADALAAEDKWEAARADYFAVLDYDRASHALFPQDLGIHDDLCWSLARCAYIELELQNEDSYRTLTHMRHEESERLLARNSERPLSRKNWAESHREMARAARRVGQYDQSLRLALQGMHVAEQLSRDYPRRVDFANTLGSTRRSVAKAYEDLNRLDEALAQRKETLEVRRRVALGEPAETAWLGMLLTATEDLVETAIDAEDQDLARRTLLEALDFLSTLRLAGASAVIVQEQREVLQQCLAAREFKRADARALEATAAK